MCWCLPFCRRICLRLFLYSVPKSYFCKSMRSGASHLAYVDTGIGRLPIRGQSLSLLSVKNMAHATCKSATHVMYRIITSFIAIAEVGRRRSRGQRSRGLTRCFGNEKTSSATVCCYRVEFLMRVFPVCVVSVVLKDNNNILSEWNIFYRLSKLVIYRCGYVGIQFCQ